MLRVAIDGPAGSGKSTVAKMLAKKFNMIYVDTGAMYRFAAYLKLNYDLSDDELTDVLSKCNISFEWRDDEQYLTATVFGKRIALKDELRSVKVSNYVSEIAKNPDVRNVLTSIQKEIAKKNSVIMDGRDIGTVVIPDAELKIFLDATAEERAKRRYKELASEKVSYEDVLRDIKKRDEDDMKRDVAPLKKAEDAILIDTTGLSINDVFEKISELIGEKNGNY